MTWPWARGNRHDWEARVGPVPDIRYPMPGYYMIGPLGGWVPAPLEEWYCERCGLRVGVRSPPPYGCTPLPLPCGPAAPGVEGLPVVHEERDDGLEETNAARI